MTAARYSFCNRPCPESLARTLADRMVLRDEQSGQLVKRFRTAELVPLDKRAREDLRIAVAA